MSKKKPPVIDPELERQLASAGDDQSVQATFTLAPAGKNPLMEPQEVHQTVKHILDSAQEESGRQAHDYHVMPMVQSFAVAAPPGVVRAILKSADVASAMANVQSEDMRIGPAPTPRRQGRPRDGGKSRKGKS